MQKDVDVNTRAYMASKKCDVVATRDEFLLMRDRIANWPLAPTRKKVLLADPAFFDVEYAINPFMKDASGELHKVDKKLARQQWESLKTEYQKLGCEVFTILAPKGFPDFVFAANQTLNVWDRESRRPLVILSRMRSEFRRGEVPFFESWFIERGYRVESLDGLLKLQGDLTPGRFCIEGNGDVLPHPGDAFIWGGVGQRTDRDVYDSLSLATGLPVVTLTLVSKDFYHLDTCFSILSHDTVAIQESAFSKESLAIIHDGFKNVIAIDYEECLRNFAGNCHSPDGRNVILQRGASKFCRALKDLGFITHEVDTSEFMKSGGSVFCMKMMMY